MKKAYMGIDIGSISTKGVIIDEEKNILASVYLWTEGNPMGAAKKVIASLGEQLNQEEYQVMAAGTTGSARKLVGAMCNASIVKNEITAHAVGTTTLHPDVRTILEIGGQDSKIICVENGVAVDYAMNTLCAAGTGSFLSSQARRLGVDVEEFGKIALSSSNPTPIAARCTVFAESDLVHKIQMGHKKEDIIAGLCHAVANNYLNNIGKGKKIAAPIVFQGGVSKNEGRGEGVCRFSGRRDHCGRKRTSHGLATAPPSWRRAAAWSVPFSFDIADMDFLTREVVCPNCPNHCEIICVYREGELIDSWGNRCERGEVRQGDA